MQKIHVSLVYATPQQQYVYQLSVNRGQEAVDLISQSGIMNDIPELSEYDMSELQLGIYSEKISHDHLLSDGDRVEIYRPLKADPKEVRRQLALIGKTMGKG